MLPAAGVVAPFLSIMGPLEIRAGQSGHIRRGRNIDRTMALGWACLLSRGRRSRISGHFFRKTERGIRQSMEDQRKLRLLPLRLVRAGRGSICNRCPSERTLAKTLRFALPALYPGCSLACL